MASLTCLVIGGLLASVLLFFSTCSLILQKLEQLDPLPDIAISGQHSKKAKAEAISLMRLKLPIHTSLLPHAIGQSKSQGHPRFKRSGNRLYPFSFHYFKRPW